MAHARQHRRHGEIGVGIGPANAMFDMTTRCRPGCYAEADGAVVHAPCWGNGRIAIGLEPAIAVGIGRKDQKGIADRRLHPGNGLAEERRARWVFAGKGIFARRIQQGGVKMHAIARALFKWLGHEGCFHAIFLGNGLHHALVQDRVIAGA